MTSGLLVVVGLFVLVGLGQWYVTRPTTRRPIDVRRARSADEAKYGKDPSLQNNTFGGGI